ncbi:MAG TPA: class I SAM-dependent methyltransferase [Chloroflexota bacterium]|nr:class I SAM-dependent methyltransferase [Chloroflexota bacterium]
MPRFDADWIDSMLRPERRGAEGPEETIARLRLRDGDFVADVGCGPGYFALPAARAVAPRGVVYAVDREPRMLEFVRQRARAEGIGNLTAVTAEETIPLADESIDLAFCALVLHDLADPAPMIRELVRITRRGGRVAIVEWLPEPQESRPNRLAPARLATRFAGVAVQPPEVTLLGPRQYLAVFGLSAPFLK